MSFLHFVEHALHTSSTRRWRRHRRNRLLRWLTSRMNLAPIQSMMNGLVRIKLSSTICSHLSPRISRCRSPTAQLPPRSRSPSRRGRLLSRVGASSTLAWPSRQPRRFPPPSLNSSARSRALVMIWQQSARSSKTRRSRPTSSPVSMDL